MALEHALAVVPRQPHMPDDRIGHPELLGDPGEPARLAHLVLAVPLGLAVHGGHHVEARPRPAGNRRAGSSS